MSQLNVSLQPIQHNKPAPLAGPLQGNLGQRPQKVFDEDDEDEEGSDDDDEEDDDDEDDEEGSGGAVEG